MLRRAGRRSSPRGLRGRPTRELGDVHFGAELGKGRIKKRLAFVAERHAPFEDAAGGLFGGGTRMRPEVDLDTPHADPSRDDPVARDDFPHDQAAAPSTATAAMLRKRAPRIADKPPMFV